MTDEQFLHAFESTQLEEADFDHTNHVRAGFLLTRKLGFVQAIHAYSTALKALTQYYGVPEKYHETITIAYLVLINERLDQSPDIHWETFRHDNPDIFDKNILQKYYSASQLASPTARRVFQLPNPH